MASPRSILSIRSAASWAGTFLVAALFAGCAKVGDPDPEPGQAVDGLYDTAATGPVLAARELNEDASARNRLLEGDEAETAPVVAVAMGQPNLSSRSGGEASVQGSRMGPGMTLALLKASAPALGKRSATAAGAGSTADTAGFRYGDSAKGYIQQVREKPFSDSTGAGTVVDSLVFRWPYTPSNPAVLFHGRAQAYADGRRAWTALFDEDGDGILNQAAPEKTVMLRKEWTLRSGDTAWKTVSHTVHGQTTYYDSLGAGRLSTWTDSVFLAGKNTWWRRTYDGDGDRFALTAAGDAKPRILRDEASSLPDGSLRTDFEAFGPGPDGDFLKPADNERYAWRSAIIDAQGKDLLTARHGDADGDGLYWSPAPGAKNRAYSVRIQAGPGSLASYKDSLVQDLPADASDMPRTAYFASEAVRKDGVTASVSLRLPPGLQSGGADDTVQIREVIAYAGYAPKAPSDSLADRDSVVTTAWLIPGDPASAADDRLIQWHRRIHCKAGGPLQSAVEQVRADAPFAPGTVPASGMVYREEVPRPASGKGVVRTVRLQAFGGAGPHPWKRTDWFGSGDSAVSTGSSGSGEPSTYARELGPEARCAGWRDPATGGFRDTVARLDARGKVAYREIHEGTLKKDGTGSFTRRTVGAGRDSAAVLYTLALLDGLPTMVRGEGPGRAVITFRGDTAVATATLGGLLIRTTWVPEGGAFKVTQAKTEAAGGKARGGAVYTFGADGSGAGVDTRIGTEGKARDGAVRFRADGSIYYDGVKVPR